MMRRLSLQIYWTFVSILLLFAFLVMVVWWIGRPEEKLGPSLDKIASVAVLLIPGSEEPIGALDVLLDEIRARIDVDISVYGRDGQLLASVGAVLPGPAEGEVGSRLIRSRSSATGSVVALALPDGRWLLLRESHSRDDHWMGFLFLLLLPSFTFQRFFLTL